MWSQSLKNLGVDKLIDSGTWGSWFVVRSTGKCATMGEWLEDRVVRF